ncbi:MAG: BatD family protein [Steroidobacterales bacterium]
MRTWAVALLALLIAGNALGAVTASLDASQVGAGEPVRLILKYDGQTREQPDLAPLQQEFDILSTSRSNNMQIINGSLSSHTETQVILAPKRTGQILVPQITWAGELSNPLTLTVSANGAAAAESVFLETIVDQKEPYVQAAVNVTVRIYSNEQLVRASLEFAGNSDVLAQQVGADRNRTLEKNGRQYDAIERHYVLFPQKSGELKLPGAQLTGQVVVRLRPDRLTTDPFADLFGGGMAGGTKPVRVHGDDVVLQVRPRPAGTEARYWLPARNVTLTEQWHPDNVEAHVGDPITRDLHLRVEGLTAAQLPDLSALLGNPAGLKAYPDSPKLDNGAQGDAVIGSRDQSVAMIADKAGKFELPPLRVSWWDTQANQPRELVLPGRTLTILPAAGSAAGSSAPGAATGSAGVPASSAAPELHLGVQHGAMRDPWLWASLALALLWVGTLLAWWMSRRPGRARPRKARPERGPTPLSASQARAEFQAACRRNDTQDARHALLAWAATVWPEAPPQGLEALAKLVGDDQTGALLLQLDRALYRGADWNGEALALALRDLTRRDDAAGGGGDGGGLAPLYR